MAIDARWGNFSERGEVWNHFWQDTESAAGGATITSDLAATEAQDVAAFAAVRLSVGTLAYTEAQDTAAFSATLAHVAALAATEAQDVAAFAGVLVHVADLAATEAQDVAAFGVSVIGSVVDTQQGGAHGPFSLYNYWRNRLGEEEEEKVKQAVLEAVQAEVQIAESVDQDRDIAQALETRKRSEEAYLATYKAALLEKYLEAAIIQHFREEVAFQRFEMKRRAALLLLLAA